MNVVELLSALVLALILGWKLRAAYDAQAALVAGFDRGAAVSDVADAGESS